ncbi:MAG TPA: KH domain-containing protein, partial [Mycoplasmatales bacterium]|nr:KH domain-containing protein [Mycoplasmatales bacterium]
MISIKTIIIVISLILLIFFNVYIQKKKLSDEKFFIQKEKDKLEKDLENSKKQQDIVYEQMKANLKKEKELAEFSEIINRKFYEVSNISPEEAREIVFKEEKSKIIDELNYFTSSKLKELKRLFQKKTINLLCNSFEKYVSDLSFSKTVNSIYVNDEIASKIIGKDGRNIKFFRKITGTDVIIKNTEKSNHFSKKNNNNLENKDFLQNILVEISCFDPQRREIAIQTLNRLVELGSKITP